MHIYIYDISIYIYIFKIRATLWDHVLFRSLGNKGALHNIFILVSMYFLDLFRPVGLWAKKKLAQNYTLLLILLRLNQHFLRGCECFTAEDVALCPQRRPGRRSLGSLCTASAYDRRSTGDCS